MNKFTIYANEYLQQNIQGYYHEEYRAGNWKIDGTIENIITTLKNDIPPYKTEKKLKKARRNLSIILETDLLKILKKSRKNKLLVCVVPRAKATKTYRKNQLLFRKTVKKTISNIEGLENGTKCILRYKNTRTTHRDRAGYGGDGDRPYPGITKKTCHISNEVNGRNILLIDDLYTKSINIDEDAIQALLDNGAKSVIFYAPGKTVNNLYS